ncbi:MAG: bL9 family ribosomal protein [Patescibacteria group bacterium]|jgi:large subunit ribosomal protein L9
MSSIQVVLLEKIPSVGEKGEIIQAKLGYAQNFLIPQKKAALLGSDEAREILAEIKVRKQEKTEFIKVKEAKKEEQVEKRKIINEKKAKLLTKIKK